MSRKNRAVPESVQILRCPLFARNHVLAGVSEYSLSFCQSICLQCLIITQRQCTAVQKMRTPLK